MEATVLWVGMVVPPDVRRANSPNKISIGRVKPPRLDGRRLFVCPRVLDVLKGEINELRIEQIIPVTKTRGVTLRD